VKECREATEENAKQKKEVSNISNNLKLAEVEKDNISMMQM